MKNKKEIEKRLAQLIERKENDMIKMGISTFVINQSWIALKEARDKGMGSVDINTLI